MSGRRDFQKEQLKALVFDLMGTCCDWHSSLLPSLQASPTLEQLPSSELSKFANDWRAGFFAEIHARFQARDPTEDIDITHRRLLDRLLSARGVDLKIWDEDVRQKLVDQWHFQIGWPDALPALSRLREKNFLVVLANGTTRLQLDIAKYSGLPFHALFSSQLLGLTKPDPAIYVKAMELMQLRPEECAIVAAHAYDLRAAKKLGMGTIYIQRATEDLDEDMTAIREEVDLFIDGTGGNVSSGLGELADMLGYGVSIHQSRAH
ncbi:haloacid dehalogenase [Mollisia scopiformis]|uniref:Haloacid dehalogenase n=1 Tax=Mollisia scopiformis TaxID=149040 RepID=A0A194XUJ6_MOLSC|nr:haloacid dehalogenase [Mollisia scopiformis]KUJ23709.1 haloacid dehalogenase [Mollisia scopiformis]